MAQSLQHIRVNVLESSYFVIIDDNPDDQFWLERQLRKAGFTNLIKKIGSGKQAIEVVSKADDLPLALFLDLRLNDMRGIEVIEHVKKIPKLADIPIIVLDGSSRPTDLQACEKLGVAGLLPKPASVTAIVEILKQAVPDISITEPGKDS